MVIAYNCWVYGVRSNSQKAGVNVMGLTHYCLDKRPNTKKGTREPRQGPRERR